MILSIIFGLVLRHTVIVALLLDHKWGTAAPLQQHVSESKAHRRRQEGSPMHAARSVRTKEYAVRAEVNTLIEV